MPAQTDVGLCNLALLSIGGRSQVQSINPSDSSKESDACSQLYPFVFNALARTAPWNCLRKQSTLALQAAATGTPENPDGTSYPQPPTPWLYSYAVPSDSLMIRYIMPSFPQGTGGGIPLTPASVGATYWVPGMQQIPFAVAYATDTLGNPLEVILTNQPQAQAVYTVNQPNPSFWDSLFQSAFVASLAAYLVPALSLNMTLMQMNVGMAEKAIGVARRQDANETSTSQNREASWVLARGVLNYNWYNSPMDIAYNQMVWPS